MAERHTVPIDLALQGGGSHGAFTWGVLDRLLEEPWLEIAAISGTSAGAMNAAVLAHGWVRGGAGGARDALDGYWQRVAQSAAFSPLQRSPVDRLMGRWTLDTSPVYITMEMMARVFSPYDLNPFGLNPLRTILSECVDFDHLVGSPIKLFVTATNVHTGRGRIFRNAEITADVLLASACLPTLFHAIEIDGESYWDGGYAGNPTITPLVRESDAHDMVLVQINPRERRDTPRTPNEILNRLNEISFNSPLMKELRMIALLRQVADPGHGEGARWAEMRTHRIMTDRLAEFGASSKFNDELDFLLMLKAEGRRSAEEFLAAHADDIGTRSTADIDVLLAECLSQHDITHAAMMCCEKEWGRAPRDAAAAATATSAADTSCATRATSSSTAPTPTARSSRRRAPRSRGRTPSVGTPRGCPRRTHRTPRP